MRITNRSIGGEKVDQVWEKAQKFNGLRVANFNSTYYGGGVAEMLSSMTLLMNSLGFQTEWHVNFCSRATSSNILIYSPSSADEMEGGFAEARPSHTQHR